MKTQTAEAIAKGIKTAIYAIIAIFLGKNGYDKWKSSRNS